MNNLTHEQVRAYLQDSGNLETVSPDNEAQSVVERHLAACAECSAFAETITRLERGSWNPYPKQSLSPAEAQSILQKIHPVAASGQAGNWSFGQGRWAAVGVTALGVLLVGIIFTLLQPSGIRGGLQVDMGAQQVGQLNSAGSVAFATLPAATALASEPTFSSKDSQTLPFDTHIVKAGEGIYAIAIQYDVPINELLALNKIDASTSLEVGQVLRIPPDAQPDSGDSGRRVAACQDPRVQIFTPTVNQMLSGRVEIMGTALHESFQHYKLEYAPEAHADTGFAYLAGGNQPVDADLLTTFDTNSLADGIYTLRLVVVDQTGNFPPPCQVTVWVANSEQTSEGIVWPLAGTTITGTVSITGTAAVDSLAFYRLSYKLSKEEDDAYVFFDRGATPVINGELGLWETKWLEPSIYTLRLEVVQQNGNSTEYFVEGIEVVEQIINLPSQKPTSLADEEQPLPTPKPDDDSQQITFLPPGLIYRHDNGHWIIDDDGQPQRISDDGPHPLFLTFSPSGQQALQIRQHGTNYWLYKFTPSGVSIGEHRSDYPRTMVIGWLDEQMAMVSVQYEGESLQNGLGHLALLDTVQNEIQLLEPESLLQRPPQVLADSTMVYQRGDEIVLWREGNAEAIAAEAIEIESLNLPGALLHFALSPDSSRMVSLVQGNFDGEPRAYVISDLNGDEQQILQTFTSLLPAFELPSGMAWSPNGRWLALAPLSTSLHGPQILLVSSDGREERVVGQGVGLFMQWLSNDLFVFTNVQAEREEQTYLYNIETEQKQKITLPKGSEMVQFIQSQPKSAAPKMADGAKVPNSADDTSGITSPAAGTNVRGAITITGTASVDLLAFYRLSYKRSAEDDDTYSYFDRGVEPVVDGELGLWETDQLYPGLYTLRLEVAEQDGNIEAYFVPNVRVGSSAIQTDSK